MTEPQRVADLVLGALIHEHDVGYVEPDADSYVVRVERRGAVVASPPLDARIGRAVIARLAAIAELDLAAGHTASAVVRVRGGGPEREVVVTLRHGAALRADLTVLPHAREAAPRATVDPRPGERVGRYEIVARLGVGGMGIVYRARHVVLGREYALKVLRDAVLDADPEAAPRFLREARIAARTRHPHIVDVFDVGALGDGRPYLVMELLEGKSLGHLVDLGALAIPDVLAVGRQLAGALAAAHDNGVVHADVTPSNVLVAGAAPLAVKLVDFGLAVAVDLPAIESEYVFGTPHYISPEQLRGLPATARSDQYSLGVVLFHLIAGEPPYDHAEIREVCLQHLNAAIPAVESPHGPLPARLAEVVTTMLSKAPAARFPSMHAVVAALADIERVARRDDWTRWLER